MFFSMSKTLFIISLSFFCQQTSSTKVVIVGAGISGYSAAAKLMENGVDDIIVLEAENRIGGRIYSYQLDENKFIDLGAQWVHGQKNNVIYEMLADKFNFGSSKYDVTDKEFRVSTGEVLNQESANRLFEKLYEITDDSESLAEQELNDIGSYLNQIFNSLSVVNFQGNFSDITDEMKQELKQLVHKSIAGYYASRTSFDVSAKLSGTLYGKTEGDEFNTWRTDGFKTVFEFINNKRLNPSKFVDVESKIQLNKQVTNIHWNPDANNEKIVITCEDNSKYEADQVIFTGSLGVLKDRHDKLFTPNLPKEKVEFIENSGYGTLDKIFLEFDKPFWNTEDFNFTYLVWTKSDLDEIMLTEKQWLYNVPGILNVDGFPNLLEFFVTGIFSEKSEEMSDEMVIEHMMWLLKKFYKVDIEKPKRMIRSKWNSSKNFLGSYSYFSIDAELKNLHPSILRKSLKDSSGVNKILFAGEATHHEFSGYTNGGAESGWWAAKEIIDAKN